MNNLSDKRNDLTYDQAHAMRMLAWRGLRGTAELIERIAVWHEETAADLTRTYYSELDAARTFPCFYSWESTLNILEPRVYSL